MLFSDLIRLNSDQTKNKVTIPVEQDGTLLRIYLEDDDLLLDHMFDGKKQGASFRQSLTKSLKKGVHTILIMP
jgi:hypothetical protein